MSTKNAAFDPTIKPNLAEANPMAIDSKITLLHLNTITPGRFLKMKTADFDLTLPGGKQFKTLNRDFVQPRDAVSVLLYCRAAQQILLLRQFRYPVFAATGGDLERAWIYETIAGTLTSPDEDPKAAAIRETKEETGIDITLSDLALIAKPYMSPGISTERIYIYIGHTEKPWVPTSTGLDSEQEYVLPEWLSIDRVRSLFNEGFIEDAKTILSLAPVVDIF